jgi:hypothetical protein
MPNHNTSLDFSSAPGAYPSSGLELREGVETGDPKFPVRAGATRPCRATAPNAVSGAWEEIRFPASEYFFLDTAGP